MMSARLGKLATALAAILASGTLLVGHAANAATYKWVDEKGVVHYTDKMPPEQADKGATVLDKQGHAVKKIEPAPTAEQRKAMDAAEEEKRNAAKAQEERARKDRALMLSYTNEGEIDSARKRALTTIEGQIQAAEAYNADLKKRKADLAKRKEALGDKPVPPGLERDLNNVDVELARQAALLEQKKEEIAAVSARYDADKQRWREIKSDQQRAAAALAIDQPKAAPKPTSAKK